MGNEILEPNPIREQLEEFKKLKELIGFYVANGLAKPLYTERVSLFRKEPESDDPLSRLEALSTPPKEEKTKTLEGAFFPLGMTPKDDWLCVLTDGTIMRLKPPIKDTHFNYFLSAYYAAPEIVISKGDDINSFLTFPDNYFWAGSIVYRNDLPCDDSEERKNLEERIKGDFALAKKVAEERKKTIDEQKNRATKMFLEFFGGSPFTPPSSEEA